MYCLLSFLNNSIAEKTADGSSCSGDRDHDGSGESDTSPSYMRMRLRALRRPQPKIWKTHDFCKNLHFSFCLILLLVCCCMWYSYSFFWTSVCFNDLKLVTLFT